jgi:hypothetical protein
VDIALILDKLIALVTEIDNIVLGVTAIVTGGFCAKGYVERNQLSKTIDKSPLQNKDFKDLAEKEGLKLSAKIIGKLITKK